MSYYPPDFLSSAPSQDCVGGMSFKNSTNTKSAAVYFPLIFIAHAICLNVEVLLLLDAIKKIKKNKRLSPFYTKSLMTQTFVVLHNLNAYTVRQDNGTMAESVQIMHTPREFLFKKKGYDLSG